MKKQIPQQFKVLFWDCKFNQVDIDRHKQFIIERLLEKGNMDAVKWVFNNFRKQAIFNIVQTSQNISSKTKNFWDIVLK